jgi:long-subunit fatty acid transport protein
VNRLIGRGALLALLVASSAQASIFETIGMGGRDTGMANAVTADSDDWTGLFYNPAMIVLHKQVEFVVTGQMSKTFASVDSTNAGKSLDCTYCTPPLLSGFTVGLLFPLGGKVQNRIAIGAVVGKPSFRLVHVKAQDPSLPFWYRYQNEDRFVSFLGIGVKITDEFSVGAGLQILADLIGDGATVGTDLFNKTVTFRELDSYLANTLSPTAGLYWAPDPTLKLGLSYRSERSLYYDVPATVKLGIADLDFDISGVTHYTPHTFSLGASWSPEPDMSINADLSYQLWSKAPTPYMQVKINVSGDVLTALGLQNALALQTTPTPPGFSNTLSARFGFEYRFGAEGDESQAQDKPQVENKKPVPPPFAVRAGAFFRPTMVPRQDVPGTNLLDATAIGGSGGFGFSFADPLEIFENPIQVNLGLQLAYLLPRDANKEATDSVPSYKYSATNLSGAFDIKYDF